MNQKYKPAITVVRDEIILLECPFCGKTLIRTDFERIQKLVDYEGMPRGKVCPKCNGVAVLKLSSKTKETIRAKMAARKPSEEIAPTEKIEEATRKLEDV